eukprot:11226388-Lingulodinium_polyedra.AAC.1
MRAPTLWGHTGGNLRAGGGPRATIGATIGGYGSSWLDDGPKLPATPAERAAAAAAGGGDPAGRIGGHGNVGC